MDDGIAALAAALEKAVRRSGSRAAVNRDAVVGDVAVSLSRTRDGRIAMLRQPLPGEGGRVTLNYPDGRMEGGTLSSATLSWVERWAREDLGRVTRHGRMMALLGLPPDAFHPAAARVARPLARLARYAGCDLGEALGAGLWTRCPEGHSMTLVHPALEGETIFHRYLDVVTTPGVTIGTASGDVEMADERDGMRIALHAGHPPDTILAAAPGRRLEDLVDLPARAGEGSLIETCETKAQGMLAIMAKCPRDLLIKGERP